MKTQKLLITFSVAALATINVMASEALLSPRAAGQQVKIVPSTTADPNLAAPGLTALSPRMLDHQFKVVAGKSGVVSPALNCTRYMAGTPKMVGACADHPGAPMSCCSVAASK